MTKSIEKILANEQKELRRLEKEHAKPVIAGYVGILLVFLILLRVLDEYASNASNSLQTAIVNEFFVLSQGVSFSEGLSSLTLLTTPLLFLAILATMIMALADKIGRKPLLLMSAGGIVAGMFVVFISPSLPVYILGAAMITFFVSFDMHQLYLMEVAPDKKRATWIAFSAFFSQMALTFIAFLRLANTGEGVLAWRNIYLFPALVGIAVVVILIFFVRESGVFLDRRIEFLKTPYDVRLQKATQEKRKLKESGGMGQAFKYIFKNKQMSGSILALLLFRAAIPAFASFYESIMSQNKMSVDAVSIALISMPLTCGIVRLIAGFVSDRIGRKKSSMLFGIITIFGLVGFIFISKTGINPIIVGILLGLSSGSYWTVGDQLGLIMNESAPTSIRASIAAAAGLMQVVVALVATIIAGILITFLDLGVFCMIYGTIVMAISLIILMAKVKETKGIVLDQI